MLSLEQKLYQLIINRLDGEKLSSIEYQEQVIDLVKKGIGGFIIFGGERGEIKDFINKLQSISEPPLFIASDIERGAGQQIEGAARFPFQMAIAAAINRNNPDDVALLNNTIQAVAVEAIDIGINMPLIPVLDVNSNPDNPIICTRAFSDDPKEVAWYGNSYVRILEAAGLLSCAKHFPGHGDTLTDSHIELPVIAKSLKELMDADIYPFREAINEGVSSIMTGHLSVPALDTLPASLSEKTITGLLRKELGFEGLVLTDALNMHALNNIGNAASRCLNAGADILLHPTDADKTVRELQQAVSTGELEERKIDIAVERILKFKAKLIPHRSSLSKGEWGDFSKHKKLADTISGKAITLVKDAPVLLPIKDTEDAYLVVVGVEEAHNIDPFKKYLPLLNPNLLTLDSKLMTLIFAVFTNVAAWRGTSGIREDEKRLIKELMNKARNSIVISFGSPYVLRYFNKADILIAAYDSTEQAQLSVIECLKGERVFQGRLPVRVDF